MSVRESRPRRDIFFRFLGLSPLCLPGPTTLPSFLSFIATKVSPAADLLQDPHCGCGVIGFEKLTRNVGNTFGTDYALPRNTGSGTHNGLMTDMTDAGVVCTLRKDTQSNASAKILKKALRAELSALLWDLTRGKGLYCSDRKVATVL